jgi:hypothetical protein
MSTGAKTPEGKAKQLAGFYRWLAQYRADKAVRGLVESSTAIPQQAIATSL